MFKILLLPFVTVFVILRAIFFPWYLRWFFHLNWTIYLGLAAVCGFLAFATLDEYRANLVEANARTSETALSPTLLSEWTLSDLNARNEVAVEGIFFTGLPQGNFERSGVQRGYILLVDDLGREVKAALVVDPAELPRLIRQMTSQGTGEAVAVTVGGTLDRTLLSENALAAELEAFGLPMADDVIIIEPFLGSRAGAIFDDAEQTFQDVAMFAGLAAILAILGLGKFGVDMGKGRRSSATQSQMSAREVQAQRETKEREKKIPSKKALPTGNTTSPWDSFSPQDSNIEPENNTRMVKPQSPQAQIASRGKPLPKRSTRPIEADTPPLEPEYKSVFPGGGSAFRFKTADQIIRQAFGTLSTLTKVNHKDE